MILKITDINVLELSWTVSYFKKSKSITLLSQAAVLVSQTAEEVAQPILERNALVC